MLPATAISLCRAIHAFAIVIAESDPQRDLHQGNRNARYEFMPRGY
jgi:hypothetical protein